MMYLFDCAHQYHCHSLGGRSSRCAALTLATGFVLLLEALTATVIFILRESVKGVAVGMGDANAVLGEVSWLAAALAEFFNCLIRWGVRLRRLALGSLSRIFVENKTGIVLSAHHASLSRGLTSTVSAIAAMTMTVTLTLTVTALLDSRNLWGLASMFSDGSEKISVLEEVDDGAEGCVDGNDLAHNEEIAHEREGAALQENLAGRLRVWDSCAGRQAESVDVKAVIL